jgi:hypothetical protein
VPQCLVIAPNYADLLPLRAVLEDLDTEITTTAQLLVGAQLATVPLDMFDFAVAVLPATGPDGTPATTPSAVYLEAGIALGRGLPLIVLAENPGADLPGIGVTARSRETDTRINRVEAGRASNIEAKCHHQRAAKRRRSIDTEASPMSRYMNPCTGFAMNQDIGDSYASRLW